jgi:hypothetical protein
MSWCSDAPENEAISLFAGLLANPDMTLSQQLKRKFEKIADALFRIS